MKGVFINTNTGQFTNLWAPLSNLPSGSAVGDGTPFPFGITPAQLIDLGMNANSLSLTTNSFGNGDSTTLSLPTFIGTSIQDKLAAAAVPNTFNVTVSSAGGSAFADVAGSAIWNPVDGKFYVTAQMGFNDATGGSGSTVKPGGVAVVCGVASLLGVTVNLYVIGGTPTGASLVGAINTRFP